MTKTIDESLDIIAQSLELIVLQKKETNRLLDAINTNLRRIRE